GIAGQTISYNVPGTNILLKMTVSGHPGETARQFTKTTLERFLYTARQDVGAEARIHGFDVPISPRGWRYPSQGIIIQADGEETHTTWPTWRDLDDMLRGLHLALPRVADKECVFDMFKIFSGRRQLLPFGHGWLWYQGGEFGATVMDFNTTSGASVADSSQPANTATSAVTIATSVAFEEF
ncbi:MAG: hypothetical protein Q9167_007952, partial [Letrouitia subvulpina]